MCTKSKSNRNELKRSENVEKDWPSEFRIFFSFFQFFMIQFGRTELKLKASLALKSIESMVYSGK